LEWSIIENPDKVNLDSYLQLYRRNSTVHLCIGWIVDLTLSGEMMISHADAVIRNSFKAFTDNMHLHSHLYDIGRSMLVYGDAFLFLVESDKSSARLELRQVPTPHLRIKADTKGQVIGYAQLTDTGLIHRSLDEIVHFMWQPEKDAYYGTSMVRGIEQASREEKQLLELMMEAVRTLSTGRPFRHDLDDLLERSRRVNREILDHFRVPAALAYGEDTSREELFRQFPRFDNLCEQLRRNLAETVEASIFKRYAAKKGLNEIPKLEFERTWKA
jgi:hypothetical protein